MAHNVCKSVILFFLMVLLVLLTGQRIQAANAAAADPARSGDRAVEETLQVPENLEGDQIDSFLATLSDAQVRRLLIQELKKEASRELAEGEPQEETGGLAGLIQKFKFISNFIQWRLYELKSGAGADPEDLPKFYRLLGKREGQEKPDAFKTIVSVIGLFLISYAVVWFSRRSAASKKRSTTGREWCDTICARA